MTSRELTRALDRVAELEEEIRQLRANVFGGEIDVHRLRTTLKITDNQARILLGLYHAGGKTISAEKLMHARARTRRNYTASDYSMSLSNVYICKIRGRLGFDAIDCHRNAGYALSPEWVARIGEILSA